MRPLRYAINVTLDGSRNHRAMALDEELHRHAVENLNRARDPNGESRMADVLLPREVAESDLAVFFEYGREREAVHMAAFTSKDPADYDAFMAHWRMVLAAPNGMARSIATVDARGAEIDELVLELVGK